MDDRSRDQYTFTDPSKLYSELDPKQQHQPEPGLDAKLTPKPDLGEETYREPGDYGAARRSSPGPTRVSALPRSSRSRVKVPIW